MGREMDGDWLSGQLPLFLRRQASEEGDAGGGQPGGAVDELRDGELAGLLGDGNDPEARPGDPLPHGGAGAVVHVLAVIEGVEGEGGVPLEPAGGVDVVADVGHHVDRAGVELPWPPEEGGEVPLGAVEQVCGGEDP